MSVRILTGDCRDVLKTLEPESVHCVVTSPPYFGLRDYGVAGQIGIEPTHVEYVNELADLFEEVKRALRKDGTLWLNLGDSYAGSWGAQSREHAGKHAPTVSALSANQVKAAAIRESGTGSTARTPGLKPKDLIGIPWRVAFALQDRGWWVRKAIIWNKPNPMPENVNDRPTSAHEYIFLLSRSKSYFYDEEESKEAAVSDHPSGNGFKRDARLTYQNSFGEGRGNSMQWQVTEFRNMRDVWTMATAPFNEAHFATFPPELPERCIKIGCPVGGTVLDPFGGAGTVGLVADRLQRDAILIELNPEYAAMAERRIRGDAPMFAEVTE